jgi:HPt (histidine-containing phosphotransfer) domain-containing protein
VQPLPAQLPSTGDAPFIASIDVAVVRQMFGDDVTLIGSALVLLLRDHAAFALPITASLDEPSSRGELALRVHALRGSTGLLGATGITRLAEEAEKAIEQGRSAAVLAPILGELTSAFARLRDEAVVWLAGQAGQTTLSDVNVLPRPTIGTDELDELYALLGSGNLAALDHFRLLSATLNPLLGAVRFDALRAALGQLDFTLAAALLRQAMVANAQGR